jgi:hypothetical protein
MSQNNNELHFIPDNNLRKALHAMKFTNKDSLLSTHRANAKTLDLSGKNIKNLNGLQYFDQLANLNLNNNKIKKLENLPPNLTDLSCSGNEIEELKNLPSTLKNLDCSNNKIKTINNLPSNLISLRCSNNLMKNLPVLPSSLESINYFNNPLNIKELPKPYKNNVPCAHPQQNCLPYELVNWKLLDNNIKDTIIEILELKVAININHSWGHGDEKRKINFIKRDEKLVCESENIYRTYGILNQEPTNEDRKNEHSINIEELTEFLKNLYNRKMNFEFQIGDSMIKINLRTKRNGSPLCLSICDDCSHYFYKYEIYTTKDTISLTYSTYTYYAGHICGADRAEDIKSILNLLYIYKLDKIVLNRKYDFGNSELYNIYEWEKNYQYSVPKNK